MNRHCIDESRVDEVLRSPLESPERRHCDECPRCLALLDSYLEFTTDPASREAAFLAEADLASAREALRQFTRERLDLAREAAVANPAPLPVRPTPRSGMEMEERGMLSRLIDFFRSPVRMTAAAAFAVVLVAAFWMRPPTDTLRGPGSGQEEAGPRITTRAPQILSGGVEYGWDAWPGASGYDFHLLDRQLQVVARYNAGIETRFMLSNLSREEASTAVYWQIAARTPTGAKVTSRLGDLPQP
ncbi:MAG: hypothetical protein IT349_15585 [Candidatus Eisenbacteria bacterium]|nr:hypothetical protein [Candidatus Eisenbacteria bacterium]